MKYICELSYAKKGKKIKMNRKTYKQKGKNAEFDQDW